jgi:hypothetical protein
MTLTCRANPDIAGRHALAERGGALASIETNLTQYEATAGLRGL